MRNHSTKEEKITRKTGKGNNRRKISYFKNYNRKFHIYVGLYFLLYIWLFSISGLLLNNPEWAISNFWPDREVTDYKKHIDKPYESGDLAIAKNLMSQLAIRGEVQNTGWGESLNEFYFQVRKPGRFFDIDANFEMNRADITETQVDARGALRMLHTFTGVNSQTEEKRNWILTKIWSFSMDALAAGLIFMVLSGLYMWILLRRKRFLGLIVLGLGTGSCLFFLFGITLLL